MRRLTATAAGAAALALTACGADGGPGPTEGSSHSTTWATPTDSDSAPDSTASSSPKDTGPSTSTSSEASSGPGSATSSSSTNTGKPFDPEEFAAKIEAAVKADPTVHINVSVASGGKETVSASGEQDLANDALDMQVDLGGQKLDYRLVDGQYYLSQPPKWVPVTKDSSNPLVKQALEQTQMLSMRKQLDAFGAGLKKTGDKGTEKVDGVTTRHYTATIDTAKAYEQLGLDDDQDAPDTMIYDVWIDEDDLIRQLVVTREGTTATLTAKNWGEPVDITKPKASELAKAN